MNLIKRGAEAEIYETDFFGKRAVVKRRVPKGYRIEELDNRIRAERTRAEARTIHRAKEAGVRTPYIYDIDMQEMSIVMEFMELPRVKEVVEKCSDEERETIAESIGRTVGRLHSAGIVHGDLTTSNMLIDGGEIALIDFGLAEITKETERMASDLRVLKEGWRSAHYLHEELLETIFQSYGDSWDGGKHVLKLLEKAESRRRYVKKD
jgi:TP53 regulating kinase-like protein